MERVTWAWIAVGLDEALDVSFALPSAQPLAIGAQVRYVSP